MEQVALDLMLKKQSLADKCTGCSKKPLNPLPMPVPGAGDPKTEGGKEGKNASDTDDAEAKSGCGHPIFWTLCDFTGQEVVLSEAAIQVFDSAEGPLRQGVLGQICVVDTVGALKPFKVKVKCSAQHLCKGPQVDGEAWWWYAGAALVLAGAAVYTSLSLSLSLSLSPSLSLSL